VPSAAGALFSGARVLDLGSGCGLTGLATAAHTAAARVVLSEYFALTLQNLRHNAKLNCIGQDGGAASSGLRMKRAAAAAAAAATGGADGAADCEVDVVALDWMDEATFPAKGSFDVLCGADLVCQIGPGLAALAGLVDHALRCAGEKGGPPAPTFVHCCAANRAGVDDFAALLRERGFVHSVVAVPPAYLESPLVDASASLFDLHFVELLEAQHAIHFFTRE